MRLAELDTSRTAAFDRVLWRGALVALGAYLVGFFVFVSHLPGKPSPNVRGEAVVALTGSEERLDAAVALFEHGVGKRLLISGVHPFITREHLKRVVHGGRRFDCCVDLGFAATNTHGNATEAAQWVGAHGYRSLVVVTANYHMPRSLIELSSAMPGVRLVPYPVQEEDVADGKWWLDPHALRTLQVEYAKYLGILAFTTLFPHHSAGNPIIKSGMLAPGRVVASALWP
ncbi:MAG TPA: YdcF family protein [Rhizomicrobium sp.]|jgi:uncharacterized SAM-binding protein YcdF (DUF218 family)